MYTSVSFHRILPQHIDDYITNMRVCAEATNKEPGCIRYEVLQDKADPGMMCLVQVFRDDEAYQSHQDAEHHRIWVAQSSNWRDTTFRLRHELEYITPAPGR